MAEWGAARRDVGGAALSVQGTRREVRLDLVPLRRDVLPELLRAQASFLRDDLDHAGRSVGAIERRGRRSLHDLDALDVVRIQIVQRRDRLAAEYLEPVIGPDVIPCSTVGAHAVDENERRIRE